LKAVPERKTIGETLPEAEMRSSLEIHDMATGKSRVVFETEVLIEAPNWDARRLELIVNGCGRLYRVGLGGGDLREVETGDLKHLNNDHGLSPDGTRLAISDNIPGRGSVIYTLPAEGGSPRRVTDAPGAYWHGWSPDGATLAYCGKREGRFDIYTIPVEGGREVGLTGLEGDEGHNDGPDYSPDGRWIWFNSDRSGHAQIWRVRPDGSGPERMTESATVDWFPHPSPDGAWILYLAYPPGTEQHPRDRDVVLRLMRPDGTAGRDVLSFNGGQGTINVPCWSPDGSAFAYMRYSKP
jgi:Tol biopolymer transport system component